MSLPDQTPKLPKWPFLVGDAVLLGAAWFIVNRVPGVLTTQAMAAATTCVVFAAILGAIPFLTDYARRQDTALDERQRGLEALSRTINTAAEQISIAANGLNELTDLTHKNLKQAEQLPHKLQEKIAEFNAQLDNERENEREELEKELVELRTSETERLQTISTQIHKAVGELTRLESSFQVQTTARTEQAERAHVTFTKAQADALAALQKSHLQLVREFSERQTAALVEIDRKLAERVAQVVNALGSVPVQFDSGLQSKSVESLRLPSAIEAKLKAVSSTPDAEISSHPKRPRKACREDLAPADVTSTESTPEKSDVAAGVAPEAGFPPADVNSGATPPPFSEPAPIPSIVQIAPVAPVSAEPFPRPTTASPAAAENPPAAGPSPASPVPPERTAKKRAVKKAADPDAHESMELAGFESDDAPVTGADAMEKVLSSDGATRLIATAYIGIGNRLFIRGEGPGLTWEKGVPLQFVSIGKWRWETAETVAPVRFKLYKNDDVECQGLGTIVLDPGYQQEVVAKF